MFPIPGGPFAVPHGGLPPDLCPSCRPLRGVTRLPEPLQGRRPSYLQHLVVLTPMLEVADRAVGPAVSRVKLDTASTTCRWQQDPRGATGCPRRLTFTLADAVPAPASCIASEVRGEPMDMARRTIRLRNQRPSESLGNRSNGLSSKREQYLDELASKARGESDTAVRQLGELRPAKSALCNHRDDEAVDVATDGFQHIPGRR